MDTLRTLLILSSLVATMVCVSVHLDQYHTLIGDRCFNETYDGRPLTLGQTNPVGLSVENLISLIEKIEAKRPQLSAQQIVLLILRRFHIDGLRLYGVVNIQSQIEMKHRRITEEIMKSSAESGTGNVEFPEEILTEDEKCALFYTLSHTVNETARHDDEIAHTYYKTVHLSRSATKPNNKTVVLKSEAPVPIQSEFLQSKPNKTGPPLKPQTVKAQESKQITQEVVAGPVVDDTTAKRTKRKAIPPVQPIKKRQHINIPVSGPRSIKLTRRPREKGVASFRNDKTMAIAANRVLLGTAVGLLSPLPKSTYTIIKTVANIEMNISLGIPDLPVDPLLAVTLSDLLGIGAYWGSGLKIPAGDVLFGAEGHWNSTACQTSYKLMSAGTLATMAELRGGLDGWNIGRKLPAILRQYPTIRLSQILRWYYSPKGLAPDSTVCNRGYGLVGELENKIQREAENYIRVWNGVFFENAFPDNQLTGFIGETWRSFYQFLNKAGTERPTEERDYCTTTSVGTDYKSAPIETSTDVLFMLDNMPAEGEGFDEEIKMVTNIARQLSLGRNAGSVTVLLNSQTRNNIDLVDDNGAQIDTPLYAIAYNTTSSQCASCRTAWFDNSQTKITGRPLLMELINKTLMEFGAPSESLAGIPSKNFVWFDFGSLRSAPTDRESKRRYLDFKWRLRYEHRDVNIFMATLNKEDFKDLLSRDENWIQMGLGSDSADMKSVDLMTKITQTPQVFQYGDCRRQKSNNKVYEGYLTPGYKQYWAMYPRHFTTSRTIELRFKADKSRLRVCVDRFPKPETDDRHCNEATVDGDEVTFTITDPCRGKSFESCPGIHVSIGLSSQAIKAVSAGSVCKDAKCRSRDQIKWTFTHTGVSCSSGSSSSSSGSSSSSSDHTLVAKARALFCTNG